MLLFLRNKNPILLIVRPLSQIAGDSTLMIAFGLCLSSFLVLLLEISEAIYKLFGEESFVFVESIALSAKSCAFDILYFELDCFGRDRRDAYIKIVLHKFIL